MDHTVTCYYTLPRVIAHCNVLLHIVACYCTLPRVIAHCNVLLHTVTCYCTLSHVIAHCHCITTTGCSISPQYGFLPNRSCSTNLVQLTDDVAQSLHKNIGTDIIYFDFAKAFDTVSHDIILRKLKQKFNIDDRLLKFLQDYLAHRRQKVILDNVSSNILNVNSGAPQWSIFGPLLFIIFISDIYDCIDPNTKIS